jgi:class 3 adenylate cyclase
MALLQLAGGNLEAAAAAIRRTLEEDPWDRLGRARLLPVQVEIALEAGDLATAAAASEEMDSIANDYGSPALQATAACARGAVLLAQGDAAAARRQLRQGCRLWQEVEVPYEVARCRTRLAEACVADGDHETAVLELQSARSAFQRLGAVIDLRRAVQTLERLQRGPAAAMERETKTFMFTDIEKSTALVEALGDEAWQDLLRLHDRTLRTLFAEYGGEEINSTGDGFFVAFDEADRALEAAAAIQRRLLDQRRTGGFPIRVRIGVHSAEATKRGADYGGRGIHVAARVAALAGGGEIVASDETVGEGPWRERASAPREEVLKGIHEPVRVVSIAWS